VTRMAPDQNTGTAHIVRAVLLTWTAILLVSCSRPASNSDHRTFQSPEDAVLALKDAVGRGNLDEVVTMW
jgi:hypothetical protein